MFEEKVIFIRYFVIITIFKYTDNEPGRSQKRKDSEELITDRDYKE